MRPEKKAMVDMLAEKLSVVSSFILTDYRGLNVQEMSELRRTLLREEAELMVVPNRMFGIALKKAALGGMEGYVAGPTAVAFGGRDAVKVAKILYSFSQEHGELKVKGGYLDKVAMSGDEVEQVAKLPPKNQLLARFVGQLSGPLVGFLFVLCGPGKGLVTVLGRLAAEAREE